MKTFVMQAVKFIGIVVVGGVTLIVLFSAGT
jgi:hypothetical protein